MNNRLAIAILVFLVSQTLVAQHGHLWTTQEFKRNVQYEGYVVDLDGDTIRGFIQFADRIEIQEEGDSLADAISAIVLIAVFVAACVFWVSTQ